MKPEINKSLIVLAQELIQRYSPMIEDEYEQSRLNSWGTLLLLASMDLDKAAEHLVEQNKLIKAYLKKYLERIQDQALSREVEVLIKHKRTKYDVSILDELNQNLRAILVKTQTYFEEEGNSEALRECWEILRIMHSHRKMSHLLTLLKN